MIEEDVQAFDAVMRAYGIPHLTKDEMATRAQAIQTALTRHRGSMADGRFRSEADIDRFWRSLHLLRMTQSGHRLCTAAMVLMPVSAPIKVLV